MLNNAKFKTYAKDHDVIVIKNNKEFQKVITWGYDNTIWLSMEPSPFDKGSILLYPLDLNNDTYCSRIAFNFKSQFLTEIEFYRFPYGLLGKDVNEELLLKFEYSRKQDEDNEFFVQYIKDAEFMSTTYLQSVRQILYSALFFILHFSETRYIESKKVTVNKQKKNKTGKKKSVRKMGKVIYEIIGGENLKTDLDEDTEKRKYSRHKEAWTRRGHFRTIKRKDGSTYQKWIAPSICYANNIDDKDKTKPEQGVYRP